MFRFTRSDQTFDAAWPTKSEVVRAIAEGFTVTYLCPVRFYGAGK